MQRTPIPANRAARAIRVCELSTRWDSGRKATADLFALRLADLSGAVALAFVLGCGSRTALLSAYAADAGAPESLPSRDSGVADSSNREIAGALLVVEGTVKNHVSSILAKMGVRDRTRAVLKAADRGLL
jgi:DNA-binding NarL/FixJ family response regulator